MRSLITILIITLLPVSVLAHGEEIAHESEEDTLRRLETEAGVLPGEVFFFVDRLGEWIEVNLLTPSTKQKQLKYLEFTNERIAELERLFSLDVAKRSAYEKALRLYQRDLRRAQDMAEKILILDGAEVAVADNFEVATLNQEQVLHNLLENIRFELKDIAREAVSTARIGNQRMFEYIVVNYQFTEEDIEKHQGIVSRHREFVKSETIREDLEFSQAEQLKIEGSFSKAEEFLNAGLNIEAYKSINSIKDILYSR